MFINVSKKYDFDNLTKEVIEGDNRGVKTKEIDKLVHKWAREGYSHREGEMGKGPNTI